MIFHAINICLIAHVDYGKTTLLNSLINFSKKYLNYKKKFFFLNNNFYTIKINLFSIVYFKKVFNFIDCPGHFDFINETYKSIFISDYCILLIDISKNIEPQTILNYNLSKKFLKKIIILINKLDLFLNYNIIKKKINFFNKNEKKIFISAKYNIGLKKIFNFHLDKNFNIFKNLKIFFIIDYINNINLGKILIIKIISGILLINDFLKNSENEFLRINKIGFFSPKIIFLKKTFPNGIHFIFINNYNFKNKKNFFFNEKNDFFFKKFNNNIYYNLYVENDFFILKLIENDFSIEFEKNYSNLFGKGYTLGFTGNLHSEITFKKLKILTNYWVSNYIMIFLLNKNNYWYFNLKINKENVFEQIMFVKIYVIKKNFFKILKFLLDNNFHFIKFYTFNNLILISFYINLFKILNNFFNDLNKIINGFIFYEFSFHHFLNCKLFFLSVLINNKKIDELNFIVEKDLKNNCFQYFEKIKKNINKKIIDIKIQFLYNNRIIYTNVINCYKKNVIEKCYGGDITRKIKLLKKQKIGKKILKKINNFYINKEQIIEILKNNE